MRGPPQTRNPNYFKPGLPYIDNIRQTLVVDTYTRYAAFLTHKTEFTSESGFTPAQLIPQFYKFRDAGKINSYQFMVGARIEGLWMNLTKPPFNTNLKLRQAVSLALDRREYGITVLEGNYKPALISFREADGAFGRPEAAYWDVMPGWGTGTKKQQEIVQAKQLVIDAGYPQGLEIVFISRTGNPYITAAELFQQHLAKIGIRATTKTTGTAPQFDDAMLKLDYILAWKGFAMVTAAPEEVVGGYWTTGAARNTSGYANPEVDKLFIQMAAELDTAKRAALFKQIEEIIVFKDQGFAPLPSNAPEVFWWNRLQGVGWGMASNPSANSGLMRGDRLWLKD
ncbi:MAG: ABC transporter substrate-binding protein [Dehalococcoidia bacterium]|nr:ABC transporter substrate-binding protein [Dehalococcoidia bacterium]